MKIIYNFARIKLKSTYFNRIITIYILFHSFNYEKRRYYRHVS